MAEVDVIKYTPTELDIENVNKIRSFLNEEGIPYLEDAEVFGLFHLNDKTTQVLSLIHI